MRRPSKESRVRGALLGTLVADGLCLGSHYEYDAPTIKKAYGGKSPQRGECTAGDSLPYLPRDILRG